MLNCRLHCDLQESDVYYVPTSGLSGQNLTTKSAEAALTSWYKGPCLLEQIGVYVHVVQNPQSTATLMLCACMVHNTPVWGTCAGRLNRIFHQLTHERVNPHTHVSTRDSIDSQKSPQTVNPESRPSSKILQIWCVQTSWTSSNRIQCHLFSLCNKIRCNPISATSAHKKKINNIDRVQRGRI